MLYRSKIICQTESIFLLAIFNEYQCQLQFCCQFVGNNSVVENAERFIWYVYTFFKRADKFRVTADCSWIFKVSQPHFVLGQLENSYVRGQFETWWGLERYLAFRWGWLFLYLCGLKNAWFLFSHNINIENHLKQRICLIVLSICGKILQY